MNSITSLIAELTFINELIADFKLVSTNDDVSATAKAAQKKRIEDLLKDAKADLQAFSSLPIGHEIGGGEDTSNPG